MSEGCIPKHHVRQELCTTRPAYRNGRDLSAVKVYTVHHESQYLLVQNVPAVGAREHLAKLFSAYGVIAELHPMDDYPSENFTEVYRVKYKRIQSARFAKKKLDNHSFFGSSLHISYAPEYETVKETREKLQDRRRVIAAKIHQLETTTSSLRTKGKSTCLENNSQQILTTSEPPKPSLMPPPPPQALPPPLPPPLPLNHQHPFMPLEASSSDPALKLNQQNSEGSQDRSGALQQYPDRTVLGNAPEEGNMQYNSMFTIPPPPVPGMTVDGIQYRTPHFSRKDYGFAWVPTANSAFPYGYDPRLQSINSAGMAKTDAEKTNTNSLQLEAKSASFVLPHHDVPVQPRPVSSRTSLTKCRLGGEEIVIKQYKPSGTPPRFLPRQVKDQNSGQADATVSKKNSVPEIKNASANHSLTKAKEDELNQEIRREAFRLGKDQGPALPADPETRKQLLGKHLVVEPKVEASVISSVKAIRKRLSKFISATVPKKLRTVEMELKKEGKHPTTD